MLSAAITVALSLIEGDRKVVLPIERAANECIVRRQTVGFSPRKFIRGRFDPSVQVTMILP